MYLDGNMPPHHHYHHQQQQQPPSGNPGLEPTTPVPGAANPCGPMYANGNPAGAQYNQGVYAYAYSNPACPAHGTGPDELHHPLSRTPSLVCHPYSPTATTPSTNSSPTSWNAADVPQQDLSYTHPAAAAAVAAAAAAAAATPRQPSLLSPSDTNNQQPSPFATPQPQCRRVGYSPQNNASKSPGGVVSHPPSPTYSAGSATQNSGMNANTTCSSTTASSVAASAAANAITTNLNKSVAYETAPSPPNSVHWSTQQQQQGRVTSKKENAGAFDWNEMM